MVYSAYYFIGFIVFEDRNGVEKCISNGRSHFINGKQVEVKEFLPDSPRFVQSPLSDVFFQPPVTAATALFATFPNVILPTYPATGTEICDSSSSFSSALTDIHAMGSSMSEESPGKASASSSSPEAGIQPMDFDSKVPVPVDKKASSTEDDSFPSKGETMDDSSANIEN